MNSYPSQLILPTQPSHFIGCIYEKLNPSPPQAKFESLTNVVHHFYNIGFLSTHYYQHVYFTKFTQVGRKVDKWQVVNILIHSPTYNLPTQFLPTYLFRYYLLPTLKLSINGLPTTIMQSCHMEPIILQLHVINYHLN